MEIETPRVSGTVTLLSSAGMLATGILAQVTPTVDPGYERLGTAGVIVVAAALAMRWLIGQFEKKDQLLMEHIKAAHEVQLRVAASLDASAREISGLRADVRDARGEIASLRTKIDELK